MGDTLPRRNVPKKKKGRSMRTHRGGRIVRRFTHWVLALSLMGSTVLLNRCVSPAERLIRKGYYDLAIQRILRKARKNKAKAKDLEMFTYAFNRVQEQDYQRMQTLLTDSANTNALTGARDLIDRILKRQERVRAYLPLKASDKPDYTLSEANLVFYNEEDLKRLREQAVTWLAQLYYDEIQRLLTSESPELARKALPLIDRLAQLKHPDYPPELIERLRRHAQTMAYIHVWLELQFAAAISPRYHEVLARPDLWQKRVGWLQVHWEPPRGQPNWRYNLMVTIQQIRVTPGNTERSTKTYRQKKIVGWKTEIRNGDTVRVPIYREYKAEVTHIVQTKEARVYGVFQLLDRRTQRVVQMETFSTRERFYHSGYVIRGDKRAVPARIRMRQIAGPVPFPSDESLVRKALLKVPGEMDRFLRQVRTSVER